MTGNEVLASAAASASYNMVLQLMLRLMTFIPNAFLLRVISKEVLGVVNVRLLLLYTTVKFVAGEGFRRACLTADLDKPWRQIVNFLWCTIPVLSLVCCVVFGGLWAYVLDQPDSDTVPHYRLSVLCYSLATLIELLAEPLYILGQMLLFVRTKVYIEGLSNAARCLLSVILVVTYPSLGLIAFCVGQMAQAVLFTAMYLGYFWYQTHTLPQGFPFKNIKDLLPHKVQGQTLISWSLASLTWSFFKQSFLKQILTEGERYVMTIFDVLSFADQGVYDIINNLGSLVARFLFKPLEDSGYLFFSQTLLRGVQASQQPKGAIELASEVLCCLLKVVVLVGLVILTFGYSYSHLALDIYGGQLLSSGTGPMLLRCYCLYVLLLAINGITECFSFATMGKQEIDSYNQKMLLFSVLFLASTWYLTGPLGSAGFILANCLNMVARILHSVYYTLRFYRESEYKPFSGVVPSVPVMVWFGVCSVVTALSESWFCCDSGWVYRLLHVATGGVCGLILLTLIFFCEKSLLVFIKTYLLKSNISDNSREETTEKKKKNF